MSLIGLLGRGFGSASSVTPPATPTLTAADNADGTGAVATIADSDAGTTNRVYVANAVGGTWTLAGTRTGDGIVALSLAVGVYFAYATSAAAGASSISAVTVVRVTSTATTDCIPIRVASAVATEISRASGAGELSKTFAAAFSFGSEIVKLEAINDSTMTVDVLPLPTQEWTHRAGSVYRHAVTTIVVIRRRIAPTDRTGTGAVDTADVTGYVNLLYEIVNLLAAGRNLPTLAEAVWDSSRAPKIQLYDEAQLKQGLYVGWLHLPFLYHERAA